MANNNNSSSPTSRLLSIPQTPLVSAESNYNIDDLIENLNFRCTDDLNYTFNSYTLKITVTSLRKTEFRFVFRGSLYINYELGFNEKITVETSYTSQTGMYILNLNTIPSLNVILENIVLQTNRVKDQSHYNAMQIIFIMIKHS